MLFPSDVIVTGSFILCRASRMCRDSGRTEFRTVGISPLFAPTRMPPCTPPTGRALAPTYSSARPSSAATTGRSIVA